MSNTPFDSVMEEIGRRGYHNHRLQEHSDIVCTGILKDLSDNCPSLKADLDSGTVHHWLNVPAPGGRKRRIDLLIGESLPDGTPDLKKARICLENKSVVTAHRNRDARFDDLNELVKVIQSVRKETVVIGTVMVGIAEKVLNVADRVKSFEGEARFSKDILPRLSKGDVSLWEEFDYAVSYNKPKEMALTVSKFRTLPTRTLGSKDEGFDFLLLVPVFIDNVNPPSVPRPNPLGIDVNREYSEMLTQVCRAYGIDRPSGS